MYHQIVLWKWSQPNAREVYTSEHVNVMCNMLRRNLNGVQYRIICITDDPEGITECQTYDLWEDCDNLANATKAHLPSCYRRLKLFDKETQLDLNIHPGDRIVSIDLDTIIAGQLGSILSRTDRFLGWELAGPNHPKVFNGSFFMFNAGDLSEIWERFDPRTSPKEAFNAGFLGSDQSWLSMNLVGKEGCNGLKYPEVASYPNNIMVLKTLDLRTRIIFFHGRRKPWHPLTMRETAWVSRYWR